MPLSDSYVGGTGATAVGAGDVFKFLLILLKKMLRSVREANQ